MPAASATMPTAPPASVPTSMPVPATAPVSMPVATPAPAGAPVTAATRTDGRQWERPHWHQPYGDRRRSPGGAGHSGDNVLRGSDAQALTAADFRVNLRNRPVNADDRLAEAHAVGFAAGWAQGRLEAAEAEQAVALRAAAEAARIQAEQAERFDQALRALAVAAAGFERRALPTLAGAEQLLVQGAFQLAEAVLGAELRHLPDTAHAALDRVLTELPVDEPVVVRLSPGDQAVLDLEGTGEFELDGRVITLIADPELTDGDAIGECAAMTVDARMHTALERAREVLHGC